MGGPAVITPRLAAAGIMDELAARHGFQYEVAKADIDEGAIRHDDARRLVLRLAHAKADAICAQLRAAGGGAGGLLVTCDQVVLHEGRILEKPADEAQVGDASAAAAGACGPCPHVGGGCTRVASPGTLRMTRTAPTQARQFIAGYARAPASTVGSVVLTDLASGRSWEGVDEAEVCQQVEWWWWLWCVRVAGGATRAWAVQLGAPSSALAQRRLKPAGRERAVQIHFEAIPAAAVDALIEEGEVYWCAGGLMVEHALVAPHVTRMHGSLDSVMGLAKQLLLRLLCQAADEMAS